MFGLPTLLVAFVTIGGLCLQGVAATCECFPAETISTSLEELVDEKELYTQAASISSQSAAIDNATLALSWTDVPGHALAQMTNFYTDRKPVFMRASIKTAIAPGTFYVIGPSRTYIDYILGKPCKDTFVIYRCIQTGTCVTDIKDIDVFIASKRACDYGSCIKRGVAIAQQKFPGLEFYNLRRSGCDRRHFHDYTSML